LQILDQGTAAAAAFEAHVEEVLAILMSFCLVIFSSAVIAPRFPIDIELMKDLVPGKLLGLHIRLSVTGMNEI
jgi:hypothetical protein